MKLKCISFLLVFLMITSAGAQETRQHDAHAHGVGNLNVVIEGNTLAIELISPSANIVGFEYLPGTDEEKQKVEDAQAALKQVETLFGLTEAAQCKIEHIDIESSLLSEHKEGHKEEGHDEHEEEGHDEHEEEGHDEHEEEGHDEHESDNDTHSEFHAQYEYVCEDMEKLTEINVSLFNVFPLTQELNVQLLSTAGQSAKTLSKDNFLLEL